MESLHPTLAACDVELSGWRGLCCAVAYDGNTNAANEILRLHRFYGILPFVMTWYASLPCSETSGRNCSSSKEAKSRLARFKEQTGRYSAGRSESWHNILPTGN